MAEWTADANAALVLTMARATADKESLAEEENYERFSPTFTYPIFGDAQTIYGYRDLVVDLRFASGSLKQYLSVQYSKKLPSTATVDDVEGTLKEFLYTDYYKALPEFEAQVENDALSFKPFGQLIYSYTRPSPSAKGKGKFPASQSLDAESEDIVVYEVYHATPSTPGFQDYVQRMQIFILLYIEAGSFIDESDERWEFTVLYEKRKRKDNPSEASYHFIGYSSLYQFFFFPDSWRLRLSQFVIIPPYQRQGHGSELYNGIYQYVLGRQDICELTVEDPAEAFEDLRDQNDLKMLLSNQRFMEEGFGSEAASHGGGRVGGVGRAGKSGKGGNATVAVRGRMFPPIDRAWVKSWRRQLKIADRQFDRLIEMLLTLRIDPSDRKLSRAYRLQVKHRLYRFNFSAIQQLEPQERPDLLDPTFQNVQEGYMRILTSLAK